MTAIVLSSNPLSLQYGNAADEDNERAAQLLSALHTTAAAEEETQSPEEQSIVMDRAQSVVQEEGSSVADADTTVEESSTSQEEEEAVSASSSIDDAMQEIFLEETDSNDDQAMPEVSSENPQATYVQQTRVSSEYGGLSNLGNTCYMASALQMLASLDDLPGVLRRKEPEGDSEKLKLREAFLDLIDRLSAGETVRPDDFKSAMDEKSPLFIGYRQQDSHEFLTTLLDSLDEDYNNKDDDVEEEEKEEVKKAPSEPEIMDEDDDVDMMEGSNKRARTEEPLHRSYSDPSFSPPVASLPSATSFSDFNVDDIGHLLHDTAPSEPTMMACSSTSSSTLEPKCKLVGGRMNTADVVLTRFGNNQATEQRQPMALISPPEEDSSPSSDAEKPTSPVAEYFTTTVRVRLTCDSCKYSRAHEETFLHLSLEIGSQSGSVEDGLRRFFAPEKREIKCEKCFCATATQTSEIIKLPRALLLHFKRFIVDVSPDYTSVTYRKNQSAVDFQNSLTLDEHMDILGEFMATDCSIPEDSNKSVQSYALRSVVNHIGSSASCGHYTADANRLYDQRRRWTRFNDSYVSAISESQAVEDSRQTAYMVMYELE